MWPEGVPTVVAQQAKSPSDVYESGHWLTDGRNGRGIGFSLGWIRFLAIDSSGQF